MRTVLLTVFLLALAVGAYIAYGLLVVNPRVIAELEEDPSGERAAKVLVLTLPSGKQIPVNYLEENGRIYLGADGGWWRAFQGTGAEVTVLVSGEARRGNARAVLDDPALTADVFSRLRPTVPKWLPDWANGKLIAIEFEDSER